MSTEWLADNLESSKFVLIDAGEFVAYRRAHVPGAIGLSHPYLKGRGSKLVMDSDQFDNLASSWGLSNEQPVVVYDDNASLHAARIWWVLRYFGHKNHCRTIDRFIRTKTDNASTIGIQMIKSILRTCRNCM